MVRGAGVRGKEVPIENLGVKAGTTESIHKYGKLERWSPGLRGEWNNRVLETEIHP
jgi:hypothetical protein